MQVPGAGVADFEPDHADPAVAVEHVVVPGAPGVPLQLLVDLFEDVLEGEGAVVDVFPRQLDVDV